MPKKIDHTLRKKEILRAALELFSSYGYEATTLADIAKAAHIARPTLYQYFRNKHQILFFASKQFTDEFIVYYQQIVQHKELDALHRLRFILSHIVLSCQERRRELVSQSTFILKLEQEGRSISELIHRRTKPLKNLLSQLLEEARQQGQLLHDDVPEPVSLLMTFITSGIVHVLLFPTEDCSSILQHIATIIELLTGSAQKSSAKRGPETSTYESVQLQLLTQIEEWRRESAREQALYYRSRKKNISTAEENAPRKETEKPGELGELGSELEDDEWHKFFNSLHKNE